MILNQEQLVIFVQLWQDPATTVTQVVTEFNAAMTTAQEVTVITVREATVIAAGIRKELRKRNPPVELLDKRRKPAPDYEALARVAQEAGRCS